MVLAIKIYPDPVLREMCETVEVFDADLKKFSEHMLETMYEAPGVGLAAPQVGDTRRVFVVDVSDEGNAPLVFVNPEIIAHKDDLIDSEEGCLSIPEYRAVIPRFSKITLRAQDVTGKSFDVEAEDLFGRCLQHELDHLNGKLFIDKLSSVRKQLFRSWLKKHGMHGE